MEFTDFDGVLHILPPPPGEIYGYEFYIYVSYKNFGFIEILGFDGDFFVVKEGERIAINFPSSTSCHRIRYDRNNGYTVNISGVSGFSLSSSHKIVCLSDNLLPYKDKFYDDYFYFDSSFKLMPVYCTMEELTPYDNVFSETFGILPVLLIVIVSFIGIRKGISFLIDFLKKS